ncbi:MAG: hypothetical protein COB02_11450 [Candidatus Cloacimonadota bacterium]|nr:MAG: hypothetical protein COB02_11450 [Candidatus Cloacimonadota bacterium]
MKSLLALVCGLILIGQSQSIQASETEIDVHGYLSRGYMKSSKYNYLAEGSKNGTTKWGEVAVNFGYQAHDRLRIGFQILARELGTDGRYKPELDWGFLDYEVNDWLSIKYGRFFAAWGFHNDGRDADVLRNSILLPQSVYTEDNRSIALLKGFQLHGTIDLDENNSLDYQYAQGNNDINSASSLNRDIRNTLNAQYSAAIFGATAGVPGGPFNIANPITSLDVNMNKVVNWGVVWNTQLEGLRIGYSTFEPDIDINAKVQVIGNQYTFYDFTEPFKIVSLEYVLDDFWTYTYEHLSYAVDTVTAKGRKPFLKVQSYYHQVTYMTESNYEFGLIRSVGYNDTYTGKKAIDLYTKDLGFTVRTDIQDNVTLKLEYHKMSGTGELRPLLNSTLPTSANNLGKNWDMFMAKVTYKF